MRPIGGAKGKPIYSPPRYERQKENVPLISFPKHLSTTFPLPHQPLSAHSKERKVIMDKDLNEPHFFSVPEAAKLCGVSRNTLYTWVKQGKIRAYQTPGRTNLIRPSDLVSFMEGSGMFIPADLSSAAQEDEKVPEARNTDTSSEGPAILVVDDEALIRNFVTRAFRSDLTVYQAETGYEALHLLTFHKNIKVVLLDLHMPGQHGLETLREMTALRPDVAVGIITGFEDEISVQLRATGHISEVLRKPFGAEDVKHMVERLLAGNNVSAPLQNDDTQHLS